jgi:hypothetical protein
MHFAFENVLFNKLKIVLKFDFNNLFSKVPKFSLFIDSLFL